MRRYLSELPPHLPAPYRPHQRGTDQYGYAAFEANYYWVPGTNREDVTILEYSDKLKIYRARQCLAEYPLPPDGVKNHKFAPPGEPKPPHNPNNRKRPTKQEEKRLRDIDPTVSSYLDFALKPKGIERHQFLRRLFALSRQMTPALFIKTIERALRYRIDDLDTLRNIARLSLTESDLIAPVADIDETFRARDTYLEGRRLVRARYDRCLEEEPRKLFAHLENLPVMGEATIAVPRQRWVHLSQRCRLPLQFQTGQIQTCSRLLRHAG